MRRTSDWTVATCTRSSLSGAFLSSRATLKVEENLRSPSSSVLSRACSACSPSALRSTRNRIRRNRLCFSSRYISATEVRVPEPDARFGRELLDEGPAVRCEDERRPVGVVEPVLPRAVDGDFIGGQLDAARIPLRLLQHGGHVGAELLGLDHADTLPF